MLAELKNASQITISEEIIKNLGISEGDKFEVVQKDTANQKEFASVDDMFADMGLDSNT